MMVGGFEEAPLWGESGRWYRFGCILRLDRRRLGRESGCAVLCVPPWRGRTHESQSVSWWKLSRPTPTRCVLVVLTGSTPHCDVSDRIVKAKVGLQKKNIPNKRPEMLLHVTDSHTKRLVPSSLSARIVESDSALPFVFSSRSERPRLEAAGCHVSLESFVGRRGANG